MINTVTPEDLSTNRLIFFICALPTVPSLISQVHIPLLLPYVVTETSSSVTTVAIPTRTQYLLPRPYETVRNR